MCRSCKKAKNDGVRVEAREGKGEGVTVMDMQMTRVEGKAVSANSGDTMTLYLVHGVMNERKWWGGDGVR